MVCFTLSLAGPRLSLTPLSGWPSRLPIPRALVPSLSPLSLRHPLLLVCFSACEEGCLVCSSADVCTACADPLASTSGGNCNCPAGYYDSNPDSSGPDAVNCTGRVRPSLFLRLLFTLLACR